MFHFILSTWDLTRYCRLCIRQRHIILCMYCSLSQQSAGGLYWMFYAGIWSWCALFRVSASAAATTVFFPPFGTGNSISVLSVVFCSLQACLKDNDSDLKDYRCLESWPDSVSLYLAIPFSFQILSLSLSLSLISHSQAWFSDWAISNWFSIAYLNIIKHESHFLSAEQIHPQRPTKRLALKPPSASEFHTCNSPSAHS